MLPVLATVTTIAEAAPHAAALGMAFQLTNCLRDVAEDLDRVYLPADELAAFGVDGNSSVGAPGGDASTGVSAGRLPTRSLPPALSTGSPIPASRCCARSRAGSRWPPELSPALTGCEDDMMPRTRSPPPMEHGDMGAAEYLIVLGACALITLPLELGARVYRRPCRLLLAVLPVSVIFLVWDALAIAAGAWDYDSAFITGVHLPGGIVWRAVNGERSR